VNDRETYWPVLAPLALLVGFASLALEMFRVWPWRAVRPDFLWCLAFFAARRAPAHQTLAAFFFCGVARDLLAGPKLGAGALSFPASAWALLALRDYAAGGAFAEHLVLAGIAAVVAETLLRFLNAGLAVPRLWSDCLVFGLADGLMTLAFHPATMLVFSIRSFKPWRERKWTV
jgi:rod shape-determining protein MreD